MQKIVLAYNFTPARLQALKLICMMLKVQLKPVAREDMLQPIGYLAGLKDIQPAEKYTGTDGTEEMLLLCGFTRPDLNRLLAAIKKGALKQVDLKAMLTPHNAEWNGLQLFKEISQEHAYMHGKQAPKPKHDGSTQA